MDQMPVVQVAAGIMRSIRWYDLRAPVREPAHCGRQGPLYIARQLGHADAGFTLKTYGHLFETIKPIPVEWPEDLLWPSGYP